MIAARLDWEAFRTAVRADLLRFGKNGKPMPYAEAARLSGIGKVTLTRLFQHHHIEAGAVLAICRWLRRDPFDFLLEAEPDTEPHWQPKGKRRPKGEATAKGMADLRKRLEQGGAATGCDAQS